ncbi:Protein of unknown function [Lactobacillus acidophilus DSM 20079 = JCM 1132 = NBRC 13951 = CIP 76.13]
MNRGK